MEQIKTLEDISSENLEASRRPCGDIARVNLFIKQPGEDEVSLNRSDLPK